MKSMKKKNVIYIAIIFILLLYTAGHAENLILNNVPTQVLFSPNGGCTAAIVKEINNAKNEILVQAYSFTSNPIAKALVDANKRGVKVEIILDKSQMSGKYSSVIFFKNQKIATYVDNMETIAHNKIIIIDQKIVINGSFNFTKAAEESNAENLMILYSPELAKIYLKNYMIHRNHSEILN